MSLKYHCKNSVKILFNITRVWLQNDFLLFFSPPPSSILCLDYVCIVYVVLFYHVVWDDNSIVVQFIMYSSYWYHKPINLFEDPLDI